MNELDFPISAKEVMEATKKLKKGKSSGSDSILKLLTHSKTMLP
jgi:predicted CopG family antitoxin